MISYSELYYDLGIEVSDSRKNLSKYTYLTCIREDVNYRYLDKDILFSKGVKKEDIVSYVYYQIVQGDGGFVLLPNFIGDEINYIVFRSVANKDFFVCGYSLKLPYGIGAIKEDFSYGDYLLVVEGPYDRDCIMEVFPNTVAVLSAGLSLFQKEVLKTLTNNILLLYDNDSVGRGAAIRDKQALYKENVYATILKQHPELKDTGDLGDCLYREMHFKYDFYLQYYKNLLVNYV